MDIKNDALLIRREYNQWVANETLEDYSLRYTAKKARRWSTAWVANTALGIVAFLALEAIGGTITLNYGFTNAMWAILVVGTIIFLSGLPLSYYAARDGVDIDLLTRGAGFGYIGSTISSLVYASFTFIFFAIEAAIMSMALHMMTDIPLSLAYIISTIVVIPLATHGISRISRFQAWTQPIWLVLQILPLVFIALHESSAFEHWVAFTGTETMGQKDFNLLHFGAAAAVIFPLIAQNGEQADFLRFLPVVDKHNKLQWWLAVVCAGPGWVIFGMIKLFIGSFLTVLVLSLGMLPASLATDPAHMYAVAYTYVISNTDIALWVAGIFVVISQLKINVTNAYAGSIAWGNFFSRLTHSHPGRVVWLVFNVTIALMLMELGLYQAFESILVIYASLVVAWVGSVVADLVINKPLGLSPPHIEFRRSHLYDINPVGVFSMFIASCAGIAANLGVFGELAEALAAFISLSIPFVTVPLIAWLTHSRYYLCRPEEEGVTAETPQQQCLVCENNFDHEDMSQCPSYNGSICSLCCALDSRCRNMCRPEAHLSAQTAKAFGRFLPPAINQLVHSVTGHFAGIFIITTTIIAGLLSVVLSAQKGKTAADLSLISGTLWQVFFLLMLVTGILIWLYVLAQKSARFALSESQFQTELLSREINAHEVTAVELVQARDEANAANLAKSRYLSGVSHELRSPLNTIFGYAQLMETDVNISTKCQKISGVIRRSSEHLSDVIDGLLEISKIEARKLELQQDTIELKSLIQQLEDMFRPLAEAKGLTFEIIYQLNLPPFVTTDEKRLRQILLNLLSNAIKFTPVGKIEFQVTYRNQVARMFIRDTGIGIAENDKSRIFEPFERVRDNQTQLITGTGLGLSISHLLTIIMGGSLELKSQLGVGTEFCLSLFLPSADKIPALNKSRTDILGYVGRPQHIMIVDDEHNHRNLINEFLNPLGFIIHQAQSAEHALDIFSNQTIDLFLLDLNMPEMNGRQLMTELRNCGFNGPIIILSANAYEETLLDQGIIDFQAFISKPVRVEKLLEQIQRCLNLQWRTPETALSSTLHISEDISQLDISALESLRSFAKVGYLKGVIKYVESLEFQNQQSPVVKQLRQMADECNLEGIISITRDLIKEGEIK